MARMRAQSWVVCLVLAAAPARLAHADTGADEHVTEAHARAARGDFIGAAGEFRAAFRIDPRPDLLCNVGIAYYKAKDLPRAHRYLEQCLIAGKSLDPKFVDQVTKAQAAVVKTLGAGDYTPVDLLVQPASTSITIDGGVPFDEPIVGSGRVWFPFGTYSLRFTAAGHRDRVVELVANKREATALRIALEVAPAETKPDPSATPPQPPSMARLPRPPDQPAVVTRPPPVAAKQRRSVVPALIGTSVTVGLGITATALYAIARSRASDAGDAQQPDDYFDLREQAMSLKHASWIIGGVAGASALVTGYLWYRATRAPRVEVQATGSAVALAIHGRF